jgi:TldD protein
MLTELRDRLVRLAADYGEIHVENWSTTRIVYANQSVDSVSTSRTSSGNVRVLSNGGWGFASFNEPDFGRYLLAAQENASLVGRRRGGEVTGIRKLGTPVTDTIVTSCEIQPSAWSLEQKNDLARRYNELLQHPRIASTRVTYMDWQVEKLFANTEGSMIRQVKTFAGVAFGGMARDGTNVQQAFESVGQYGGMELVTGHEERVEAAKKRALDLLDAKKLESGSYRVLLDPNLAGVFIHEAFGHLSEADFLHENPKMQEVMVLGRRFGPDFLNVIDDGSIPGLAGYTPYDDEGVPARRNWLIREGRLTGRLHSRETAGVMREELTGNARAVGAGYQPIVRMTNTFIDRGSKSFEELLSTIDDGVYAIDYLGGMTNLEMFTFSAGHAYRVRNGKICELLRDVVLSGNVFTTLGDIAAVGDDLEHFGGLGGCGKAGQGGLPVSTGSPHIVVNDVLIGGV